MLSQPIRLAEQSPQPVALDGAAEFPRHRQADTVVRQVVVAGVDDQSLIADGPPPVIDALKIRRPPQVLVRAEALVTHRRVPFSSVAGLCEAGLTEASYRRLIPTAAPPAVAADSTARVLQSAPGSDRPPAQVP